MPSPPRGPDVLGIGAQRAGTTWLHRNLQRHRDVKLLPAPLKEVHYFDELHVPGQERVHQKRRKKLQRLADRLEANGKATPEMVETMMWLRDAERDDDWYRRLFTLTPRDKLAGEITPAYSLLPPEGIAHLLGVNPDVRLILMLRHPVERAWSGVRYTLGRTHDSSASAELEVPIDRLRALAFAEHNRQRTDYPDIIGRFRAACADDQLLILFYDRISSEPDVMLADVARFLGLDPRHFGEDQRRRVKRHNDAPSIALPPELARELAEAYRDDVRWLVDHVPGVPGSWLERVDTYAMA